MQTRNKRQGSVLSSKGCRQLSYINASLTQSSVQPWSETFSSFILVMFLSLCITGNVSLYFMLNSPNLLRQTSREAPHSLILRPRISRRGFCWLKLDLTFIQQFGLSIKIKLFGNSLIICNCRYINIWARLDKYSIIYTSFFFSGVPELSRLFISFL